MVVWGLPGQSPHHHETIMTIMMGMPIIIVSVKCFTIMELSPTRNAIVLFCRLFSYLQNPNKW